MTNREAIDILRCRRDGDAAEALEIVLKAAEEQPCEDAVSKKAVIDTIEWYRTNPHWFTEDHIIEDIKGLPSVQPVIKYRDVNIDIVDAMMGEE